MPTLLTAMRRESMHVFQLAEGLVAQGLAALVPAARPPPQLLYRCTTLRSPMTRTMWASRSLTSRDPAGRARQGARGYPISPLAAFLLKARSSTRVYGSPRVVDDLAALGLDLVPPGEHLRGGGLVEHVDRGRRRGRVRWP